MKVNNTAKFPAEGAEMVNVVENSNERSSAEALSGNLHQCDDSSDSGDGLGDAIPIRRKKRIKSFSDCDSETENRNNFCSDDGTNPPLDSERSNNASIFKSIPSKSRIRKALSGSDSDSNESSDKVALKNDERQSRMKNKQNKMSQKFKGLVTSRAKQQESEREARDGSEVEREPTEEKHTESSDMSNDEESSIDRIRQIIKARTVHLKSTIYDPDTSDEESGHPKQMQKMKKERKSTKLTPPKAVRMSAKQASENMQKIKSESNRMLREKEVSLPYHRPKALALKDILSRRRPAVSSDGKSLPIKMNAEQLKQYVLTLEQRQKEMIELCKSDTDEEDTQEMEKNEDLPSNNDSIYDDLVKTNETLTDVDSCMVNNDANVVEGLLPNINLCDILPHENNCNKTEINDAQNNCNNEDKAVYENSPKIVLEESDISLNNDIAVCLPNAALEGNTSAEMELAYNDSLDDANVAASTIIEKDSNDIEDKSLENTGNSKVPTKSHNTENSSSKAGLESDDIRNSELQNSEVGTESDSQTIFLHYETEQFDTKRGDDLENIRNEVSDITSMITGDVEINGIENENKLNDFSDDDINMEDIDILIENAEILSQSRGDNLNSPLLVRDQLPLNIKPKLTGAPGMVIDLESTDSFASKKLTGVELLKQRFTYFAQLKTAEEIEREREKRTQPGLQHLKLKQVLEEEIADQQSLEWSKRLEDAKKQQMEMDAVRSDAEDDIDNIEAKLEKTEEVGKENSSESEEEEEEELSGVKEKPRKRNAMIADEADESDCDDMEDTEAQDHYEDNEKENDNADDNDLEADDEANEDNEETYEESSEESEEDNEDEKKQKKGRILKAFEDSEDEDAPTKFEHNLVVYKESYESIENTSKLAETHKAPLIKNTQDDELQLAQRHKSFSDDLFTSHESAEISKQNPTNKSTDNCVLSDEKALGTQTFSILNTGDAKPDSTNDMPVSDSLIGLRDIQFYKDGSLRNVVCSGSFSQSLVASQYTQQSQGFGEDVFALCTGKFDDNQFVTLSQMDGCDAATKMSKTGIERNIDNVNDKMMQNAAAVDIDKFTQIKEIDADINKNIYQDDEMTDTITFQTTENIQFNKDDNKKDENVQIVEEKKLLNCILDELNDPEFEKLKPNKYFVGNDNHLENKCNIVNSQINKKFIIDSDDEGKGSADEVEGKKKKLKERKRKQRALQISDDEEEASDVSEEVEDEMSETEIDLEDTERIIDYDSEENEVVVDAENPKKKRKATDFFEREAELSSEDEWAGSGDEDEAGLDRMEREAGDDDTFHQGRLQRELGQIHMRDVLDQDKREVRLIQELLFEDGDLGGGHRQRKFRWKNAEGDEDTDATHEFADTQEEEFESEEQWRKQRHEREMFLKDMKKQDETNNSLNVSNSRNSIIKANLSSKSISSLVEVNIRNAENIESPASTVEKKVKDIPSPKKPFIMHKQNYHNSLLTRGRGALARLAALATPLTADEDAPRVAVRASGNSNFVFTALPTEKEKPKTIKRKAVANAGTPRLVKKMRTEEIEKVPKSSLIHYLNT